MVKEKTEALSWGALDAVKEFLVKFPGANSESSGKFEISMADDNGWRWAKEVSWGEQGIEISVVTRG